MKHFRYKNILLYTSHQWCGNTANYFIENSERIVVFLLMQRIKNKDNVLRLYEKGKLVKEENISLSENFFLYYFLWCFHYMVAIFKYFPRNEKLIVVAHCPYIFFAMTIQKLLRNIDFVYWIADYFPPISPTLIFYEKLKRFYHKGITYRIYLGDGVNKIMNGKVVNTDTSKTILWGIKPKNITRNFKKISNTLLYVGVIRPNVGLEIAYKFLKVNKEYNLKIIGVCDEELYKTHLDLIKEFGINNQVYFPNRFFFDDELNTLSKECLLGIALYETTDKSTIYYADPGKVKAYTEMNLPVIITKTSSIFPYIKKLKAGEVIERNDKALGEAIKKIKNNYSVYLKGISKFNTYFYYDTYYGEKFKFLEKAFA